MKTDPYSLPADLSERLARDYLLSVVRLITGRTDNPLEFVLELDGLLDVPEERRTDRFTALLSEFEGRLSAPPAEGESAGTVYL